MKRNVLKKLILAWVAAAVLLLPACTDKGKIVDPEPTATPAVSVAEGSFADGRAVSLAFKLLYAMDSGANGIVSPSGLATALGAVDFGAQGDTATALGAAMGAQGMEAKDVAETVLHMRQGMSGFKNGEFAAAWSLFVGEQQAVKEEYLSDSDTSLTLPVEFYQLDAENGNQYLSSWADEATGGGVKQVNFKLTKATQPVLVDIFSADPDWQRALDTGKSKPLPFTYADGKTNAVPTLNCVQKCGVYDGPEGSVVVLPDAGDQTRLVIMVPSKEFSLHDFIPIAAEHHDEWLKKTEWAEQRVLLPRFNLSAEGSAKKLLYSAGFNGLLEKGADYSTLGNNLYFSDVFSKASLVVDESGVEAPDPNQNYYQGVKDSVPTFAADRPFLVLLERTDTGQVLLAGMLRDPLNINQK